ncbi:hypothetical protein [Aureispira sp. CCB-E]|uniref:hypothetical protein n=1 Tax=Aureispira sp. CCB-E TaxID=3051121 RepID=UPI00286930F2|nr:hypothetical protein [Aureispira sp. CCB-E]WMX14726.1 hypothetical protein QP953_28110 [Aureispira sp. CCB-E]
MFRFLATLAGVIGGAVILNEMLTDKTKSDRISGINKDYISDEFLIRYKVRDDLSTIKQRITRNLNLLIGTCNSFKLGDGGEARAANYNDYSKMYLLCVSSREDYIDLLENYYIEMYEGHPQNMNQRRGGGRMQSHDGKYYLYVVID